MSVIKQMDEKLANMIAAGEVVERPASVIKELVENAIDAKATIINISIKNNGLKNITVSDNGIGMIKEDAMKAPLRHATSKISSEYDLERINTLGFRGEALAAIVAVSKVKLETRTKDSDGIYIEFMDSKIVKEGISAINVGTTISVSDLFYNTPARLKYLKSEYSERAAIMEIFDKLALSNPSIRFSLEMDDKLLKETYGNNDYHSLLAQIYGPNILNDIKSFEEEFSNVKVKAFLVSPKITRARRNDITIFVNGRYIRNYGLTEAIISGYHTRIMTKRYPLALLFIEIDPYLLDVNIHPQKLEVKFANEAILKFQIENYVKNTLGESIYTVSEPLRTINDEVKEERYIKEELDFIYSEEEKQIAKLPDFEYVGNLASTYLIFQNETGMYLIDQHAAEERVNYEYYSNLFLDTKVIIQEMFVPRTLHLINEDLAFINNNLAKFNNLGFHFNEEVELIAHPNYIKDKDLDNSISNLIILFNEKSEVTIKDLIDDLAQSRSCKASIKANDKLSLKEIESLVSRLRLANNPYTCPHGRPTIINISHYEISKMFKRIVWKK